MTMGLALAVSNVPTLNGIRLANRVVVSYLLSVIREQISAWENKTGKQAPGNGKLLTDTYSQLTQTLLI